MAVAAFSFLFVLYYMFLIFCDGALSAAFFLYRSALQAD